MVSSLGVQGFTAWIEHRKLGTGPKFGLGLLFTELFSQPPSQKAGNIWRLGFYGMIWQSSGRELCPVLKRVSIESLLQKGQGRTRPGMQIPVALAIAFVFYHLPLRQLQIQPHSGSFVCIHNMTYSTRKS